MLERRKCKPTMYLSNIPCIYNIGCTVLEIINKYGFGFCSERKLCGLPYVGPSDKWKWDQPEVGQ